MRCSSSPGHKKHQPATMSRARKLVNQPTLSMESRRPLQRTLRIIHPAVLSHGHVRICVNLRRFYAKSRRWRGWLRRSLGVCVCSLKSSNALSAGGSVYRSFRQRLLTVNCERRKWGQRVKTTWKRFNLPSTECTVDTW